MLSFVKSPILTCPGESGSLMCPGKIGQLVSSGVSSHCEKKPPNFNHPFSTSARLGSPANQTGFGAEGLRREGPWKSDWGVCTLVLNAVWNQWTRGQMRVSPVFRERNQQMGEGAIISPGWIRHLRKGV